MYTERFDLGRLEMPADAYRGTTAYAGPSGPRSSSPRTGRRWGADGVASYAVHPGWVDTPGLAQRPSRLRQTRSAPADPGRRGGHGGLARRRRGAPTTRPFR